MAHLNMHSKTGIPLKYVLKRVMNTYVGSRWYINAQLCALY